MNTDTISSMEKLEQLYAENKISEEEYTRLRQALEKKQDNTGEPDAEMQEAKLSDFDPTYHGEQGNTGYCRMERTEKKLPWQIWFSMGVLAVAGVAQFALYIEKTPWVAIALVAIYIPMIFGLYHKHRWVFILYLFFCIVSIFGILTNPIAVIMNVVFGYILWTAHPHFFKKDHDTRKAY